MAICALCGNEMRSGRSCTQVALHVGGLRYDLSPFGSETCPSPSRATRCGDCGVERGGLHHLGCDLQPCPRCRGQLLSCGCRFDEDGPDDWDDEDDDFCGEWDGPLEPYGVDGNGQLTERTSFGGTPVILRRGDIPLSDITTVGGIRVTTALRTVIDLAPEVDRDSLQAMVHDCLSRRLFTIEQAWERLAQPDMRVYVGAELLREVLRAMS